MPRHIPPVIPPGLTAKQVWEYTARELTRIRGIPRTDLMGEDADFEAGVGARKSRIDATISSRLDGLSEVGSGSIVADGTEQELVSDVGFGIYFGLVSLHQMGGADIVEISLYGRTSAGGSWRRYQKMPYTRAQADPLVHFLMKVMRHGFRVTLRQVKGTMRTFDYAFYRLG